MLPDIIAVFDEGNEHVPFSIAILNEELMHECFPKQLRTWEENERRHRNRGRR